MSFDFAKLRGKPVKVDIDGLDIYARKMSIQELEEITKDVEADKDSDYDSAILWLIYCACDVNGKALFKKDELASIKSNITWPVLETFVLTAREVNGMGGDEEDEKKPSEPSPKTATDKDTTK